MKYSNNFNRDFNWYINVRYHFNFSGALPLDIQFDINGIDGKKAFLLYDSQGILKPTKHPTLLANLILIKGGVNLHIKMYAEDRASFLLPKPEFEYLCKSINAPDWFRDAVENQKFKYYSKVA